ncbi:hypothetical protein [Actinophytocola sediminis]
MDHSTKRAAFLTLAAGILAGGALALTATPAVAAPQGADITPGLVAVDQARDLAPLDWSPSNPSGA